MNYNCIILNNISHLSDLICHWTVQTCIESKQPDQNTFFFVVHRTAPSTCCMLEDKINKILKIVNLRYEVFFFFFVKDIFI